MLKAQDRVRRCLAIACGVSAAAAVHALPVTDRVSFESLDRVDGRPVMIEALLFRPASTFTGGSPAVIALHGCGGLYSAARNRETQLSERHAAHAAAMLAAGYVVLFPDRRVAAFLREILAR